jgi:hypothetical protein
LGLWANLAAIQRLAPAATLEEVRALSRLLSPRGAQIRNPGARERLVSLYTPRGWQLRQVGMLLIFVCAIAIMLLIIHVFFLPSLWHPNVGTDANLNLASVLQNKPSIFLIWIAFLVLAGLGFVFARRSPWLVIPVAAFAIIWSHDLTGLFPGQPIHIIGKAEGSYAMQVMLATAIALLATGRGMLRSKKRGDRTATSV